MSRTEINKGDITKWTTIQKIGFRFVFLYFLIQIIPVDYKFYEEVFSIHWLRLSYSDLFNIAHYTPRFFEGGQSFANWAIAAIIAIIGTFIWTLYNKKNQEYNALYYWLRVILRYRLAIALFAYGFIKLFPLQSPYPSLSNLNTNLGDFSDWKLFSLSLGIVPGYQSFLGFLEIFFASLLLFRKTAFIGAITSFAFLFNVFISNLAYEGGEYVYSLFLISIALFLFDIRRFAELVVFEKPTEPNKYHFVLKKAWQKYGRIALKASFVFFFVVLYGFKISAAYYNDPYKIPNTPGLKDASGIYDVSFFRINKDTIAYSLIDSVRWRDVVFEKWGTLSIRTNNKITPQSNNIERLDTDNNARTYELDGSIGRRYYAYTVDEENRIITLQNRNKNYQAEKLVFHYTRPNASEIILAGVNYKNDSIYVVLDRINKRYLLEEAAEQGRAKKIKI